MVARSNRESADPSAGDDSVFTLLSRKRRRYVLQYLIAAGETVTEADDLIEYVADREPEFAPEDRDALVIQLHHQHLPKLAEHSVIEYDEVNETVRYRGDDRLERHLAAVSGWDPE